MCFRNTGGEETEKMTYLREHLKPICLEHTHQFTDKIQLTSILKNLYKQYNIKKRQLLMNDY